MRRNIELYNYVAVDIVDRGRQLEMIAFLDKNSDWVIYRAMEVTVKVVRELGTLRRQEHGYGL